MVEDSGRVHDEGEEERDGDTSEEEDEEQATILYDVVSYREWEQEPEVKKKQGDVLQGKSRAGWLQLTPPPSLLPPRVEAIQVSSQPLFLARVKKCPKKIETVYPQIWVFSNCLS